MGNIVGVRFTKTGKLYYMDPQNLELKIGDKVIATSERGEEIARVVSIKDKSQVEEIFGNIQRLVTKQDLENEKLLKEEAKGVLNKCKKLAKKYELGMKFTFAEYTLDKSKLICYFVAEDRVDFRDIVKELATEYRVRIELRQIGSRDEVKDFPSLGTCGKEVCCRSFLENFDTVTIKMAKEQGLQINMPKLSGVCGRFKCCLKYEEDTYKEKLKHLPKVNEQVKYNGELCKVVSLDVLKEKARLKIGPQGEERFEMVDVKDIKRDKKNITNNEEE